MVVHVARTNIDLDEELVQRVMVRYHLSTKREAGELLDSIPDFSVPTESGPPAWEANHDSD